MQRFGVIDAVEGQFVEQAQERYGSRAVFEPCGGSGDGFDAIIITPAAPVDIEAACSTVVVPGTRRGVLADHAISYGLSPRDTVTLSSASDRHITVSLQRDITTPSGKKVIRQEFDFPWIASDNASIEGEALPLAAIELLLQ